MLLLMVRPSECLVVAAAVTAAAAVVPSEKRDIYIAILASTCTNSLLQTTSDNIVFDGLGFESCLESQKVNNSRIQRTVCFE